MSGISWLTARPIAHRGLHDMNKTVWENTLPAFARALEANYAIECDVHLTADGVPIVFHDSDLKRLTGTEGNVWQKDAAELRALTIGSTRDHPPTLDDMLDFVGGRVPLVIELKGVAGHDAGLVEAVADLLGQYAGKAAIMSFDHWLVREFKHAAPRIAAGLTACGREQSDLEAHFSMLAHDLDFISYGIDDMPNPFVDLVRNRLSMPVITWTVRNPHDVEKTARLADQMTFEGFVPDETPNP